MTYLIDFLDCIPFGVLRARACHYLAEAALAKNTSCDEVGLVNQSSRLDVADISGLRGNTAYKLLERLHCLDSVAY